MTKYGYMEGAWVVPRYSPPGHPSPPTTPGTPLPPADVQTRMSAVPHGQYPESNMVVGLISVGQLTWRSLFSGFWTITEVYNLTKIGRISNHSSIPGIK